MDASAPLPPASSRPGHRRGLPGRARALLAMLGMLAGFAPLALPAPAEAAPKRIIIVRHGEKLNPLKLCATGEERARALAAQYLSPTSPMSLLKGERPAAILAITLHTLETARPIAAAWGMRVPTNALMLTPIRNNRYFNSLINVQNRKVARDLLENPRWHGTTVVLVWEHFHIASAALEAEFAGEEVTLRQLLHLDQVKGVPGGVPATWPNPTFNYFWILDYDSPTAQVPARFTTVRQNFAPPFANLPNNAWGTPEQLPPGADCT
ncbi:histidine phosphatase family protein [Ancylobacter terrae]|uniref:histidine phosphatase family protein n=1 Tax=Ancylobacter sp. sgz301288 TaxID=3342077 RepID=UPI0038585875